MNSWIKPVMAFVLGAIATVMWIDACGQEHETRAVGESVKCISFQIPDPVGAKHIDAGARIVLHYQVVGEDVWK